MPLIIVRHGQSQGNHENRFCGWIDIPLTDTGRAQATNAADLIARHHLVPDVLFTLKLTRLIDSGDIIIRRLQRLWVDHYKTWKLNERHYGQWQGRNKTEVCEEVGVATYDYVRRNYHGCPPLVERGDDPLIDERYDGIDDLPRGELLEMAMNRMIPYYHANIVPLLKQNKTVLVVTHGLMVRSFIKYFAHVSDDHISEINVANAVPLVVNFTDDTYSSGDYYYLDPELAREGAAKIRDEGKSQLKS